MSGRFGITLLEREVNDHSRFQSYNFEQVIVTKQHKLVPTEADQVLWDDDSGLQEGFVYRRTDTYDRCTVTKKSFYKPFVSWQDIFTFYFFTLRSQSFSLRQLWHWLICV